MIKEGALSGIKVIDLTRVISGPFCTLLLADMGAEVIKIEPPKGDNVRNQGEFVDGYSAYFAQFNRNKKSVILDLYQREDKEKLKKLLKNADVIVDNFRPGVLAKMGFDRNTLSSINPSDYESVISSVITSGKLADGEYRFEISIYSGFSENDLSLTSSDDETIIVEAPSGVNLESPGGSLADTSFNVIYTPVSYTHLTLPTNREV